MNNTTLNIFVLFVEGQGEEAGGVHFESFSITLYNRYGILAYSGVFTPDGSNFPYLQPLLFNASQHGNPIPGNFDLF